MLTIRSAVSLAMTAVVLGCGADDERAAAGTATAGQGRADGKNSTAGKKPAELFPPTGKSLYRDHRGNEVDLKEFQGRIVVLNFWATWCPPCRYEIPDLVRLRTEFRRDEVAILGVSIDQGSEEQVRPLLTRFIEQFDINYPVIVDSRLELLRHFVRRDLSAVGVPMTFVIDPAGRLFSTHEGLPQVRGRPDPAGILRREIQTLQERRQ